MKLLDRLAMYYLKRRGIYLAEAISSSTIRVYDTLLFPSGRFFMKEKR